AILSGPGSGFGPIAGVGTNQSLGIAAEDAGWISAGIGISAAQSAFGTSSREQMVRYLYWLYGHHPLAKNIISHYVNLTIGEGFKVLWKKETDRTRWRQIASEVKWARRVRRTIRMTYLLGEWFSVFFPLTQQVQRGEDGKLQINGELDAPRNPDEPVLLRGLGPDQIMKVITRGDDDYDRGTTPDAENVIAYARRDDQHFLGAGDVIHHRTEEIGNLTRGQSVIYPVLKYLRYWDKFVDNRHWLNHMRARIPLVRKVTGGAARVSAQAAREQTLPPPGTMLTENQGTSIEFPTLNLDAQDAQHDGRTIVMAIAAGVNLPVYFVISDAADTNYAGLMASDSPVVAMFEGLQEDYWIPDLAEMVEMLTGAGDDEFSVEAGAVMKRNIKTISDACTPLVDRFIMSRQSAAQKMGLDWDEERERIALERSEEAGFRSQAGGSGTPDALPADKGGRPARDVAPGDTGTGDRRPRPSE
ncbi:MAG: phage portal protein, partial [Salinibacterium sp.]